MKNVCLLLYVIIISIPKDESSTYTLTIQFIIKLYRISYLHCKLNQHNQEFKFVMQTPKT